MAALQQKRRSLGITATMDHVIHPEPANPGDLDLSWMVGRIITHVTLLQPHVWQFFFGEEAVLTVECPWRILEHGHLVCSGEDHGQQFGLPAPVDAAALAMQLLSTATVTTAHLREGAADILIDFTENRRLEIITLSRGYESWQLADPFGASFVAQGGGRVCTWR